MSVLANCILLAACVIFLWVNYRVSWTSHCDLSAQPDWMVAVHPRLHRAFLQSRALAFFSLLVAAAHLGAQSVAGAGPGVTWIALAVGALLGALAVYLVREVRRDGP